MNEQNKRDFFLDAASIKHKAAQYIISLQHVIHDIDADILRLEGMIPPLLFQKDITGEEDHNTLIMVSAIGSSLTHIQVSINMLRNQKALLESCLKNAKLIPEELSKVSTTLGSIPQYEE